MVQVAHKLTASFSNFVNKILVSRRLVLKVTSIVCPKKESPNELLFFGQTMDVLLMKL